MAGGFARLQGHGAFVKAEFFGDVFTAEAVRRPFDRRRGEADLQFLPLSADHLVFTRPRLDKKMDGDAMLANLQPGGDQ